MSLGASLGAAANMSTATCISTSSNANECERGSVSVSVSVGMGVRAGMISGGGAVPSFFVSSKTAVDMS